MTTYSTDPREIIEQEALRCVRRYATGTIMDIDDMRQIARLACAEATHKFNGRGQFGAFLRMRIRQRLLDEVRRLSPVGRKRYKQGDRVLVYGQTHVEAQLATEEAAGPDPETLLLRQEQRDLMTAAIMQLPPEQRRVITAWLLDRTVVEISRDEGVTRSAVNQRRDRAINRLRRILSPDTQTAD